MNESTQPGSAPSTGSKGGTQSGNEVLGGIEAIDFVDKKTSPKFPVTKSKFLKPVGDAKPVATSSYVKTKKVSGINEAMQRGVLYHFTTIMGFDGIVGKGFRSLENKYVLRDKYERGAISFTRQFNMPGGTDFFQDRVVRIAIDGDKLSNILSIKPYNEFQEEYEERVKTDMVNVYDFIIQVDILRDFAYIAYQYDEEDTHFHEIFDVDEDDEERIIHEIENMTDGNIEEARQDGISVNIVDRWRPVKLNESVHSFHTSAGYDTKLSSAPSKSEVYKDNKGFIKWKIKNKIKNKRKGDELLTATTVEESTTAASIVGSSTNLFQHTAMIRRLPNYWKKKKRKKKQISESSYQPYHVPENFYIAINIEHAIDGLKKGMFIGLRGISDSGAIAIEHLGAGTDAILVMPGQDVIELNKLTRIMYDNPDYMVSNDFRSLRRLFNKEKSFSSLMVNIEDYIAKEAGDKHLSNYIRNTKPSTVYKIEDEYNKTDKNFRNAKQFYEWLYKQYVKIIGNKFTEILSKEIFMEIMDRALRRMGKLYSDEGEWMTKSDAFKIPRNSEIIIGRFGVNRRKDFTKELKKESIELRKRLAELPYEIRFVDFEKFSELRSDLFFKENFKDVKHQAFIDYVDTHSVDESKAMTYGLSGNTFAMMGTEIPHSFVPRNNKKKKLKTVNPDEN